MNCPVPQRRVGLRRSARSSGSGAGTARWDKIEVFTGPVPAQSSRTTTGQVGLAGEASIGNGRPPTLDDLAEDARSVRFVASDTVPGADPRRAISPRAVPGPSRHGIGVLPWYYRTWLRTLVPLLLAILLLVALAAAVNTAAHRWAQGPAFRMVHPVVAQAGP